jgi:hypothetical protein
MLHVVNWNTGHREAFPEVRIPEVHYALAGPERLNDAASTGLCIVSPEMAAGPGLDMLRRVNDDREEPRCDRLGDTFLVCPGGRGEAGGPHAERPVNLGQASDAARLGNPELRRPMQISQLNA